MHCEHMINLRISADWSTTNQIAAISCTPRVQKVHTKAEVVHHSPGLLGLVVLFNCNAPINVTPHPPTPGLGGETVGS